MTMWWLKRLCADTLLCHQVIETATFWEKAVIYWKMLVRRGDWVGSPVGDDGGGRPEGDVWFRGSRICVLHIVLHIVLHCATHCDVHHCCSQGSRRNRILHCLVLASQQHTKQICVHWSTENLVKRILWSWSLLAVGDGFKNLSHGKIPLRGWGLGGGWYPSFPPRNFLASHFPVSG